MLKEKISRHSFLARTTPLLLVAVVVAGVAAIGAEEPSPTPMKKERKVSDATRKEILIMEDHLREAIEKRDSDALKQLLADYYTDAMEEGERALSKTGALIQCEAGKLDALSINKPEFAPEGDRTKIEGLSQMRVKDPKTGSVEERPVQVRRFWGKQDGRWLLTAQLRAFLDKKEERK